MEIKYYVSLFLVCACIASCANGLKKQNIQDEYGTKTFFIDQDSLIQGTLVSTNVTGDTLEISNYLDGKLEGSRQLFKNGVLEIKENYKDGTIDGIYEKYFPTGKVEVSVLYEAGEMNGILKRYYEDGALLEEVQMAQNVENGPFTEYYPDGTIHWQGTFENGDNEVGILSEFNNKGELIKKLDCGQYNGEYICQTIWELGIGDIKPKLEYDQKQDN